MASLLKVIKAELDYDKVRDNQKKTINDNNIEEGIIGKDKNGNYEGYNEFAVNGHEVIDELGSGEKNIKRSKDQNGHNKVRK